MAPTLTSYLTSSIILFMFMTLLLFVHHEVQIYRNPETFSSSGKPKVEGKVQILTEQISRGKEAVKRKELLLQKELLRGPPQATGASAAVSKTSATVLDGTRTPATPKIIPTAPTKATIPIVEAPSLPKPVITNGHIHHTSSHKQSFGEEVTRRGDLVCDGKKTDHEIIYWKVVPGDSTYESPVTPHHGEHDSKYMTFEYDGGGWNNIRMGMECMVVAAHAMGRTLVIPPQQHMYLLKAEHKVQ
jgi:hypothetical protein